MSRRTPANPCPVATKKILDPLPIPVWCNCCMNRTVVLRNNSFVYGREFGSWPWIYLCEHCGSHVSLHSFTALPKGSLADKPTREARKRCKNLFIPIHNRRMMSRTQAYKKLAEKLGLKRSDCHFALFDVDMCEKAAIAALEIINEVENNNH